MTETTPKIFVVDAGKGIYNLAAEIRDAGGLDEYLEKRGIKP